MTDIRHQLESTLTGAYTLERELGGGGMSRVFVAHDLRLGRKVVVKVLSPELAAGISADRFEREIKLAASLQQANIVPVLSAGESAGLPFYTMPYVEGESLRARLGQPAPLTAAEILRILGDVARALQYAHARGIVHRDIKPDNVLLSGGTAVVTDFGIAKALAAAKGRGERPENDTSTAALTSLGTSLGTPAYMAPEQAAGDPDIDARADIYAFGCLAFELLAGHPPFHGRTPQRVLAAHMGETPQAIAELRPGLSPSLADLVMRCLAKDPAERPQSAAEIARTLDNVSSGGELAAMPPVLLHGPAAFRRALLAYVVAVVLVAVVARAATVVIGLPDWVFPGAMIVMALGLPVILFTGYVQSVTRRALTATPRRAHSTLATFALKASRHVSWQRTTRGGIIALGAFALLIVGFMVLRAFGIGPAGTLFGAGTLKVRDPIMIADFGVSRADSSVASVVAEAVRANLSQSTSIVLATPASIAAALRRSQRPANTPIDVTVAKDIAEREGFKAIVTGDVTGLGGGYVIALRLVTADSGALLASYQTTVNGPADLIAGVDVIAKKLRGKMGESLKSVQASPPLAKVTTASIDALRNYTIGSRANDVERDFPKAVEHLRQAVAVDSNFAMAWRKLAAALNNARFPRSAADSAIRRAHALPERLTETERLLTDGYFYSSGPGRDRAKAIAAYEAMLERGDSLTALNNLALLYNGRREFAKAESLYRAGIRRTPDGAITYGNLAATLFASGRISDAGVVTDSIRKRFPANPLPAEGAIMVMYHDGHLDAMDPALDSARRSPNRPLRSWALSRSGDFDFLRGRKASSRRWYLETWAADSSAGIRSTPGVNDFVLLQLDVWLDGPSERTAQRLDSIVAHSGVLTGPEPDRQYTPVAATYALAGRPDKARAMLARMRSEVRDTSLLRSWEPATHSVLGEIALAERRGAEAVAEFRKSDRLPDGPASADMKLVTINLARAFDVANQPDSAIAYFERYLAIPYGGELSDDAVYLAGTYKRLGELYDAKGDAAKAESYLTKFVTLWAKADPELQPRVAEAKQRLARLRDREKR